MTNPPTTSKATIPEQMRIIAQRGRVRLELLKRKILATPSEPSKRALWPRHSRILAYFMGTGKKSRVIFWLFAPVSVLYERSWKVFVALLRLTVRKRFDYGRKQPKS
jgi:hypothetical protein